MDIQAYDELSLQLADVVGIQSALEQLVRLDASPHSTTSSVASSGDTSTDYPPHQNARKTSTKSSTAVVVNPARYKTELCRQFEEHGSCRYGDKCQFAHGAGELRSLVRHPKYKTEMCRTFHTTGFCPYGLRCHFIHNDDERRPNTVILDTSRCCQDAAALSDLAPLRDAGLLMGQTPLPHCRPIFRSSVSPTSVCTPEVDLEQRGRPILARSSALPERSPSTYHYSVQLVSTPFLADPSVGDDLPTTVRAPCA